MRAAVVGSKEHHRVLRDAVRRIAVAVGIVQQVQHPLQVLIDTGNETQIFRLFATLRLKRFFQVRPCADRTVNRIGVKLQIERLPAGVQLAHGFLQRIADRIADVFGRTNQFGGQTSLLDISRAVRLAEAVEVTQTDSLELPVAHFFRSKAARLMSLCVTANVDVEANVLRHGGLALVTAHMILADMRCAVAVHLQSLGDRNRLRSHVLTLFGSEEPGPRFADPALAIPVETAHDIHIVVDPCRVLSGQHGRAGRRAVRLRVSVRETQPLLGQLGQVRCHILFAVRPHRHLVHADVIPTQIVNHVDDDVGLG